MKTIFDTRGEKFKNNQIRISDKGFMYYGDMPIDFIKKSKNPIFPSHSIYTIFGLRGLELADIALNEADVKLIESHTTI